MQKERLLAPPLLESNLQGPSRTAMVALENCTDEELAQFHEEFERLRRRLTRRQEVPGKL